MKQRLIIEDLRLCMLKQDQPQELVRGISLEIEQGKVLASSTRLATELNGRRKYNGKV